MSDTTPSPTPLPLLPPTPLPSYTFSPDLSEDENYLTWSVVLSRHSFSRRGHMGALIVQPSTTTTTTTSSDAPSRILVHAVNTPLLYTTGHPRNVSEIHAEALCLSLAARRGIPVAGATAYVTFPPCQECFKLLLMAGIERLVYRKNYDLRASDAVLVTAEVWGVELKGTMFGFVQDPMNPWDEAMVERAKVEAEQLDEIGQQQQLDHLLSQPIQALSDHDRATINQLSWLRDRLSDRQRDERARAFWSDTVGESAVETRQRSADWWERWQSIYKHAAKKLRAEYRGGFMEKERKAQKKERVRQAAETQPGPAINPR